MNEEQDKVQKEFLEAASDYNFDEKQAIFMWKYIMETIIAMAKMKL